MDSNHLSVCTNNGRPTHLPLKNIQLPGGFCMK
nr:MAG TPA: hypothetical protein [Bacteriophage sp.]